MLITIELFDYYIYGLIISVNVLVTMIDLLYVMTLFVTLID